MYVRMYVELIIICCCAVLFANEVGTYLEYVS